ncbi:NUDIX hydrolase [Rhodococcus sp. X156]|uniref:NUDIX hydrolase n=1 Tax=Rhodococcus sp. X156 TaxID=2499145 RepID=UPI000FD7478D|nr:NUDIX hydrolase [Rhodococcus sp. X156]
MSVEEPIRAAGAVVWRRDPGGALEVAVVHRPRYDDWSLPKGKLDPGEHATTAAVREVAEETGLRVALGRYVGTISYRTDGRPKVVTYWAARVLGGQFQVNDEVDELRWLSLPHARRLASYSFDARVLDQFAERPVDTTTLLLVRHAKAGSRKQFQGDDRLRPLEPVGRQQAAALVPILRAFGATEVHAADLVRCVQTVQPLADALGVPVLTEPALSDKAFESDPALAEKRLLEIAELPTTPVVCSQGDAIPGLLHWLSARDQVGLPPSRNRKGSTWVLSQQGGRVIEVDHLDTPLR